MIRYFSIIALLLIGTSGKSQQLNQILFSGAERLSGISFLTDQGVVIRISDDGKVIEWGTLITENRYGFYQEKLMQYMGRVDYYGKEADSISQGKVKSIGTCMLNYYGAYEQDYKVGKLRSLGAVQFDYYNNFDNISYRGKLKSANNNFFTYYSSFDNEMFRGKLKSVSNTPIIYYGSFDEREVRGKIKSIGNFAYSWYSNNDRRQAPGGMPKAQPKQYINGITYIVY